MKRQRDARPDDLAVFCLPRILAADALQEWTVEYYVLCQIMFHHNVKTFPERQLLVSRGSQGCQHVAAIEHQRWRWWWWRNSSSSNNDSVVWFQLSLFNNIGAVQWLWAFIHRWQDRQRMKERRTDRQTEDKIGYVTELHKY